ncbi:endonuclease domain-containing protein [Sphingomonas sp. S2-65]|nr:endonuclease domain-containing protein [Sphingomonas sp. S2-65]
MSLPEVLLWQELRKRPGGMRFRHQHPAGPYVLDFFCPKHRLAVEVDGAAHGCGDRPERDGVRDAWLAAQGVRVVRVSASEVLGNLEGVVRYIAGFACGHYPSTAFGGPLPPPGED